MDTALLFLDFDGVICDSALECFVSSRLAYLELMGLAPETPEKVRELPERERFYRLRPFIRSGEDYLVLQKLIAEGRTIADQEEFDGEIARAGASRMEEFATAFYRARERMLAENRNFWFGLNRLYSPLDQALRRVASNPAVYILSTKKPAFILEIFGSEGISWEPERILFPGKRSKAALIDDVLARTGAAAGIFVDDQFDHLQVASSDRRIRPVLAAWGYVKPEWLERREIESMSLVEATALVRTYSGE
jgi:phosphoglycolate phosphatase-like HAD superfamily hydrolase